MPSGLHKSWIIKYFSMAFLGLMAGSAVLAKPVDVQELYSQQPSALELRSNAFSVLAFLSSDCPCSRSHEEELNRLAKQFSGPRFDFVAILSRRDLNFEKETAHFAELSQAWRILADPELRLANEYGAYKTPHIFIVGADQKTVYEGGVSDSSLFKTHSENYLERALKEISEDKEVSKKRTRALGCSIAR